ncbi:FAD-dependent oxidoreductase [Mangrovibacter sp. MFB070]|uniref:bifunctional tRNA (5-methylaminomethyl-2-thiouridine)(34)-methyltransferase MnmD/FAD-dependent 5-carboxymethylaminomethyl-2-thiouridine(34) oxidoreductase MnmC n=1 Tax=Mangrovibacter sp. MFB070 TaxID=1224318 RepID=UPI0004DA7389|nr:bifunctional tRNA (5-methylaminomethyl-2-thiouridine)(34)-methyltransferase MnmD/FAD-dependent 5-carboxymethylaminomethyl-2-thiouridine(34) oxidoreductase MnmC [Mangrovibacter sp. MFB070]KEA50077.1 FAD-dependent oxidoreductase [Mangrovibacter sp. MFB070]
MKQNCIQTATLDFNAEGTPVSRQFDDVYFSNDNGLEETRYVFLDGNRLKDRFFNHHESVFVVAESGFGTGLNFLALWEQFTTFHADNPQARLQRLHFISFEKFPLRLGDLTKAHQQWPQLATFATQLQAQWPDAVAGCHRLVLDNGRVTVDLWFGDINTSLTQLDCTLNQRVDAWFLDGFAPSRNPDMWNQALFDGMARMAKPGGTMATFTSAGFVRRGLQQAGFQVEKRKGFGRKREMLTGTLAEGISTPLTTPWYTRQAASCRETAIIGGGIASALLSLALLHRGWDVTLYCADDAPAQGASGNRQGALYPLLNQHDPALAAFFPHAFGFARRLYDRLPAVFAHDWCGVTQLAWNDKSTDKLAKMLDMPLPETLIHAVSKEAMQATCGVETGVSGICFPQGGWLCPQTLTHQVIELACQQGLKVHYNQQALSLSHSDTGWDIHFAGGQAAQHSCLVLANGHNITQFEQTAHLPAYPVAGQVSHIPTTPGLGALKQVLCYDGYLTPVDSARGQHCIGASYHRGQSAASYSEEDQVHNRQRLVDCLPQAKWAQEVDTSAGDARCGVRCATRDHLPMVGNVPDYAAFMGDYAFNSAEDIVSSQRLLPVHPDLFMLGALGSRGLCSAPLAAEILAAQMSAEPLPSDQETLAAMTPSRLWVRKWLKGRKIEK